jgi:hypothetical protein
MLPKAGTRINKYLVVPLVFPAPKLANPQEDENTDNAMTTTVGIPPK